MNLPVTINATIEQKPTLLSLKSHMEWTVYYKNRFSIHNLIRGVMFFTTIVLVICVGLVAF